MTRDERLNEVAAIAKRLEASTKLPARLLIAQWATESQWGGKPIGKANYFGMKWAARHKQFCMVPTSEVFTPVQIADWNENHPDDHCTVIAEMPVPGKFRVLIHDKFADYDSLEESCADYAWLLTQGDPYAEAWADFQTDGNFAGFVTAALTKYATASYGALALQIAAQSNVLQAIERAV